MEKQPNNFYRIELRAMQIRYGDNEKFLDVVADLVQKLSTEVDTLKYEKGMLEHQLRVAQSGD